MSDSIAMTWGSTPEERGQSLACDAEMPDAAKVWHRAIDVDAPRPVVFRWLCQLRKAPYSYDALDNYGRRSPRTLTPGLDELEVGQKVMTYYNLVAFEPDGHLTVRFRTPTALFGQRVVTYTAQDAAPGRSRIVVRVRMKPPGGPLGLILPHTLPWVDLLMMRKQLRTLARLAGDQAAADGTAVPG
ncbi:MAG: hypothetical protein JWN65_1410 [Solirubrobacterales bacterium]|jgi:hypothetical protein|nr:hypothetical protein [Solirubrobacterales bacterium]